jgi:hypothetical protein
MKAGRGPCKFDVEHKIIGRKVLDVQPVAYAPAVGDRVNRAIIEEIRGNSLFLDDGTRIAKANVVPLKKTGTWATIGAPPRAQDVQPVGDEFHVVVKGGSIGSSGPHVTSTHATREEAAEKAKRMNKLLSPGEKKYYGLGYSVKEQGK